MARTVIKFKFKKPGALSLSRYSNDREGRELYNYGVFHPESKQVIAHIFFEQHPELLGNQQLPPKEAGNAWVQAHDLDKVYTLKILDEEAGELPPHLAAIADDEERKVYRNETLRKAAQNHIINNMVREDLHEAADRGHIEVLSDTFFDKRKPEPKKPETKPEPKAPEKQPDKKPESKPDK